MKKAFKITLKLLAGVVAAIIVTLALAYLALNYIYNDTFKFYHASNLSDYETMEEMFKEGYDPNMDTLWGRPMSFFALGSRLTDPAHPFDINVAKFLLEHGVNPNHSTSTISSPLLFSIIGRQKDYIELLIEHGVDINRGVKNHTPLDVAYILQHDDIISLLAKHGADIGIAVKSPVMATRVMEYYMRGITDERPVLQLISKNFHSPEKLLEFFETAQKQTNDFYKTDNKDYDRKKVLTIIKNLEH